MRSSIPILHEDPNLTDVNSRIEFTVSGDPSSSTREISFDTGNKTLNKLHDDEQVQLCAILDCPATAYTCLLEPDSDGKFHLPLEKLASEFLITPTLRTIVELPSYSNDFVTIQQGTNFKVLPGQFLALGDTVPYNDGESWWKLKSHDSKDWIYQINEGQTRITQLIPKQTFSNYQSTDDDTAQLMSRSLMNKVIIALMLRFDELHEDKMLGKWIIKNLLDDNKSSLPSSAKERVALVDHKYPPI